MPSATAAIEEASFEVPETALDDRFVVGMGGAARLGTEGVVRGEREEARVVDGLSPLPAEQDGLLTVVLARGCDASGRS
jgi:hypothetical protein